MVEAKDGGRGYKALQVRLEDDLYEWLRAKSFFERRSMNVLVVEALSQKKSTERPHESWHAHYLAK